MYPSPSLELVILVDPVVDAARTRAAVEFALQQATQDDQKLGDVAAAADTIRVRNRAGRRGKGERRVGGARKGGTEGKRVEWTEGGRDKEGRRGTKWDWRREGRRERGEVMGEEGRKRERWR
jgi:hypothetical protein